MEALAGSGGTKWSVMISGGAGQQIHESPVVGHLRNMIHLQRVIHVDASHRNSGLDDPQVDSWTALRVGNSQSHCCILGGSATRFI